MVVVKANEIQAQLQQWVEECLPWAEKGETAGYIPALDKVPRDILGVAICDLEGNVVEAGDSDFEFSLQSISKVFTLLLALEDHGPEVVFNRVGMEPTGDPFNSIAKLEYLRPNKPLNPMINAGAIAVCDLIKGNNIEEKFDRIRNLVRKLANNPHIDLDQKVYFSEKQTGHRNRSLAYFLKDVDRLDGDVEDTLDIYFKQCALTVCCRDLAYMGAVIANGGKLLETGEQVVRPEYCRMAKAFMVTCGFYNGSGQFAVEVGIPAKSGVSGGILSSIPGRMGIGVVGPALDDKGNSLSGEMLLAKMARHWNLSIFV
ncbi:MAG: glutaminase A [Thermoanaerobacteraceae bacterium]|nr:glutaminase A [Thermoanaerobacteraceae bacterium]